MIRQNVKMISREHIGILVLLIVQYIRELNDDKKCNDKKCNKIQPETKAIMN